MKKIMLMAMAAPVALAIGFMAVNDAAFAEEDVVAAEALFNDAEQEEIGDLIHAYLLENPEVIFEAVAVHEKRQQDAQDAAARDALSSMSEMLFNDPLTPLGGNPDGDVSIVEFFDYNCPYCKRSHDTVVGLLEEDGDIRYLFKQFPILGESSVFAARAALAANAQGKYTEMHDALMSEQGRLTEARIIEIAAGLGLDMEQLSEDMDGDDVNSILAANSEAATRLGITGTPAFIIGDEIVRGVVPEETIHEMVANIRGAATEDTDAN